MMENKDIVSEVLKRADKIKEEKARKRALMIRITTAAASLLLILSVSAFMPMIIDSVSSNNPTNYIHMGTIFSSSSALGYIVMGIGSFLLGIVVTLICYRVKDKNNEEEN